MNNGTSKSRSHIHSVKPSALFLPFSFVSKELLVFQSCLNLFAPSPFEVVVSLAQVQNGSEPKPWTAIMLRPVSRVYLRFRLNWTTYSTSGPAPATVLLDQIFRPLDLTVSFVHAMDACIVELFPVFLWAILKMLQIDKMRFVRDHTISLAAVPRS